MDKLAPGARQMRALSDGGFSDEQIGEWQGQQRATLAEAGFRQDQIDAHFGTQEPDMKPVADLVRRNFSRDQINQAREQALKFGTGQALMISQAAVQPVETVEEIRAKAAAHQLAEFGLKNASMVEQTAIQRPDTVEEARAKRVAEVAQAGGGFVTDPTTGAVTKVAPGAGTKPLKSYEDRLSAGLQISVSGLLARGKAPDYQPEDFDASMLDRVLAGFGQMAGDVPFMIAGSVLGGGAGIPTGPGAVAAAGAGAFGLPAGLRATLMDAYAKGDFQTFGDFWGRASGIMWETVKGEVVGGLSMAAGTAMKGAAATTSAVGPVVPKIMNPGVRAIAPTAAEIATMVGVGSALEGHVPNAHEFTDFAALILGMKVGMKGAEQLGKMETKLRDIYAKTGAKPEEVAAKAQSDPSILGDLFSENQPIPRGLDPVREPQPILNIEPYRATIWYSELRRQVDGLKLNEAPANQWLGTIESLKGVKKEEIEATGVREYLGVLRDAGNGKVTKLDVTNFLSANAVKVNEIRFGEAEAHGVTPETLPKGWTIDQTDAGVKRSDQLPPEFGVTESNFRPGRWHVTDANGTRTATFSSRGAALEAAWNFYDQYNGIDLAKGIFFQVHDAEGLSRGIGRNPQDAIDDMLTSSSAREELGIPKYHPPRYDRYALNVSGGTDYRELIITLPERTVTRDAVFQSYASEESARGIADQLNNSNGRFASDVEQYFFRQTPFGRWDVVRREPDNESANFFGDHYGIPNNVAHTRFDTRIDPEGRKVLFVQELQSDWAQQGRKRGWKPSQAEWEKALKAKAEEEKVRTAQLKVYRDMARAEAVDQIRALEDRALSIEDEIRAFNAAQGDDRGKYMDLHRQRDALLDDMARMNRDLRRFDASTATNTAFMFRMLQVVSERTGDPDLLSKANVAATEREQVVLELRRLTENSPRSAEHPPKAPFVVKTESWVGLMLKRLIRHAAENGFERIAWTTGDQQNVRYGLSGHVDRIEWSGGFDERRNVAIYFKSNVRGEEDYTHLIVGKDGAVESVSGMFVQQLTGRQLNEILGGERSTKIMSEPHGGMSGQELEIGHEEMQTFYDKIVSNVANEILKKMGGGRVQPMPLDVGVTKGGNAYAAVVIDRETNAFLIRHANLDNEPAYWTGRNWTTDYASAQRFSMVEEAQDTARSLGVGAVRDPQPQPGFDMTPAMKARAMAGLPIMNISPKELATARAEEAARVEVERGPPKSALRFLRSATEKLDSGEWTHQRFQNEIRSLLEGLETKRDTERERDYRERVRGPEWVNERLMRAARTGELDEGSVEFARWLLEKNPALATDLGISLKSPAPYSIESGRYDQIAKVITLMKGAGGNTVVHEILHHSERMLPRDVRNGITEEWAAQYARALFEAKQAGQAGRVEALTIMAQAYEGRPGMAEKLMELFQQGTLQYSDYHLTNPSEFWAVNGSRILAARHAADTWGARARQWYNELIQKAREHLGIASDAPVMRALDEALKATGEMPQSFMLRGTMGTVRDGDFANLTPEQQKVLEGVVQQSRRNWNMSFDNVYTRLIDFMHPINMAYSNAAKGGYGGPDPYKLERLTNGVFGKVKQFVEHGTFDFDTYARVGQSYSEIMKMLETVGPSGEKYQDLNGFRAYMVSRRALEQEAKGLEHGIPLAEAQVVVRDGEAKYEPVFQARLQYRHALLDYLHKSGVLSDEQFANIERDNTAYVPFYRFFEDSGRPNTGKQVRNPVKRYKGSSLQIIDPIESDIKDTALFISLADKNEARKAMVMLGENWAERVATPAHPIEVTEKELQRYLDDEGIQADATGTTLQIFRTSRMVAGRDEIVVYNDGKPEIYKVNPDVAEAFNAVDRSVQSLLLAMLTAPASWLRAGVTLSPDFIPRNLVRDALSAFVYAGSNPVKTAKGLYSTVVKDDAYQNWLKGGGANATMVAMDRDYISQHLFELSAETGLMERAWNVAKTPIEILRTVSELAENATRVGSVRDELAQAKDKAAIQALAFIARESTVDFARRGSDKFLQAYTRMTAFMNPGIQGNDRMIRALIDNPAGTLAKSFAAITLPSIALWWWNRDDPRVKEIPRWEKDLFWIVPMGKVIVRIPKPFELGVLFGSLPERLMERFVADNPDALKDIDQTLKSALSVNMVPTFFQPIGEQWANRNLFTGHSLVPEATEKLLPEYQYNVYTTELAKKIGEIMGQFPGLKKTSLGEEGDIGPGMARALTNPTLIENYVRAWTGGLGTYVLKLADAGLRKAGALPDPVRPTDTWADTPFFKAFVVRYPSSGTESIREFYDTFNKHAKVWNTIMMLAERGNAERVARELAFDPLAMVQLTDLRRTVSEHAKLVYSITDDPAIGRDEKRQLIDSTLYKMMELSQAGNQMYKEAERSIGKAETAFEQRVRVLKEAGFSDAQVAAWERDNKPLGVQ